MEYAHKCLSCCEVQPKDEFIRTGQAGAYPKRLSTCRTCRERGPMHKQRVCTTCNQPRPFNEFMDEGSRITYRRQCSSCVGGSRITESERAQSRIEQEQISKAEQRRIKALAPFFAQLTAHTEAVRPVLNA